MARPIQRETLAKWERGADILAPLADSERDSVLTLATRSDERPLPALPSSRVNRLSPAPTSTSTLNEARLSLPNRVETTHQFFSWFSNIEKEQEEKQNTIYLEYLGYLQATGQQCATMLAEIDQTTSYLSTLQALHESASVKTSQLHNECDRLLQEQTHLDSFARAIQSRLSFFLQLSQIATKLASPTFSVLNEQFLPLLARMDESMAYLNQHPEFKDSSNYLLRFRQLHSKALATIRAHVTNTLKTATQSVLTQTQGVQAAEKSAAAAGGPSSPPATTTTQSFTLFYGKFRMYAPRIRTLMEELERRQKKSADYGSVLEACYECYYIQRYALLATPTRAAIGALAAEHADNLPAFVRAACSYVLRTCNSEVQLFNHFFPQPNPGLEQLLDAIARIFYDAARPLLLQRHVELNTLIDVCNVLRVEALEDTSLELSGFREVARELLQDAQERLIYKADSYVETEIKGFVPSQADLNYPDRLKNKATSQEQAIFDTWYPPLKKALTLLSKLYQAVERNVCESVARDVLEAVLFTLEDAFRSLKGAKDSLNAQLFLIMHLLILREQIAPFDVNFTTTETSVDFSTTRAAAADFFTHSSGLFRFDADNALLAFLIKGTPSVTRHQKDARQDVDDRLRVICHEFIAATAKRLTSKLEIFMVQVKQEHTEANPAWKQSFATPEALDKLLEEQQTKLTKELESLSTLFRLYLGQTDTSTILFRPIQAALSDVYRKFLALVQSVYSAEQQALLSHLPNDEDLPSLLSLRKATTPKLVAASPSPPPALASPSTAEPLNAEKPAVVVPVAVVADSEA
eukprot:m.280831 g.280831  ORF g.280831 m.280831 type:complete len:807 (-) comp17737_c0_seq4:1786-4206(-)